VLRIELLNDVPEKNLEGIVTVYQAEKQWTSEVTWYYTGYGEAEIICDSINETQNFRITYNEKYPKAKYLDRTIEWKEVSQTSFTFMETEELRITNAEFASMGTPTITVSVQNTGSTQVTVTSAIVNGASMTATSTPTDISEGGTASVAVTGASLDYDAGTSYTIELVTSKGNKFAYTAVSDADTPTG
jgi:hypothetical protein